MDPAYCIIQKGKKVGRNNDDVFGDDAIFTAATYTMDDIFVAPLFQSHTIVVYLSQVRLSLIFPFFRYLIFVFWKVLIMHGFRLFEGSM